MRKRLISIVLSGLMGFSLIGCGSKTDSYTKIYKECEKTNLNYYNGEVIFKGTVLSSDMIRVLLAVDNNEEDVVYISKSKIDDEVGPTIKDGDKLTVTSDSVQFVEAGGCADECDHIAMTVISDIKIEE